MLRDKTFVAIIPARGGSKGIPGKNIKKMAGMPLIYWCLKAAYDSKIFDRIVVSTDSELIKDTALLHFPHVDVQMRPANLASDTSPVLDTIQYVCENLGTTYDYVQIIQPTSPLLTGDMIAKAANRLILSGTEGNAVGAAENEYHRVAIGISEAGAWNGVAKTIPDNHNLKGWWPKEVRRVNRQWVDTLYAVNGMIYLGEWDIFANKKDYWEYNILPVIIPKEKSVDIDDWHDFKYAEWLLKERHGKDDSMLILRLNTIFRMVYYLFTGRRYKGNRYEAKHF